MKIAIDTNRYSDLDRGVSGVSTLLSEAEEIFVPFVVIAELHIGFRRGTKTAENE
jgi:predicted nucleic acid-binding protein